MHFELPQTNNNGGVGVNSGQTIDQDIEYKGRGAEHSGQRIDQDIEHKGRGAEHPGQRIDQDIEYKGRAVESLGQRIDLDANLDNNGGGDSVFGSTHWLIYQTQREDSRESWSLH